MCIGAVFVWTGEWAEADRIIDRLIAWSEKYSLRPYHAIGLGLKGELSLRQGNAQAGQNLLTACLDALEAGQHQSLTAVFIRNLAIALAIARHIYETHPPIRRATS